MSPTTTITITRLASPSNFCLWWLTAALLLREHRNSSVGLKFKESSC